MIAEKLWDKQTALIALYIALFWPQLLIMSGMMNSFSLYNTCLLIACILILNTRISLFQKAGLLGLMLGVYGYFRFEGILFAFPFLYYFITAPEYAHLPLTRKSMIAVLTMVVFAMILSPWAIRNYIVFDDAVLGTSGGYNLLRGHHENATGTGGDQWPAALENPYAKTPLPENPEIASISYDSPQDELTVDNWRRSRAVSDITHHPAGELRLTARKLYYFLVSDFTHPITRLPVLWIPSLFAFAGGFCYFVVKYRYKVPHQVLWMIFFIQGILNIMFFILPRYRMNVEFVPLLYFAAFVSMMYKKFVPE